MTQRGNLFRYVGDVRYPDGRSRSELFISVKDARLELKKRLDSGVGDIVTFDYDEPGVSIDPGSVVMSERVTDRVKPGTTIDLHLLHRNARVDPLPRYRIYIAARGGTQHVKLHQGN